MLSKRSGRKRMASERKDQVESGEEETDKMEGTYSSLEEETTARLNRDPQSGMNGVA